jgi:chondroitin 4-sulfotransferase 11
MPFSTKHKIIFIHVPKNAGTSLLSLQDFAFEDTKNSHRTARNFKQTFPELWETYTKYCIVRNPWDRFVSNFEYGRMLKSYWHSDDSSTVYPKHPDYELIKDLTFEDVVELASENIEKLKHEGWKPQHHYICDKNDNILVDKYFYSDTLTTDAEFLHIFKGLPKINTSNRKPGTYRDYYNTCTAQKIHKLYTKDIELFKFVY